MAEWYWFNITLLEKLKDEFTLYQG
jgi:hypothetical protein